MSELAATAERLRLVKNACMDFITLWALDRMMAKDHLNDRIHRDVLDAPARTQNSGFSSLYSRRRLDD